MMLDNVKIDFFFRNYLSPLISLSYMLIRFSIISLRLDSI